MVLCEMNEVSPRNWASTPPKLSARAEFPECREVELVTRKEHRLIVKEGWRPNPSFEGSLDNELFILVLKFPPQSFGKFPEDSSTSNDSSTKFWESVEKLRISSKM